MVAVAAKATTHPIFFILQSPYLEMVEASILLLLLDEVDWWEQEVQGDCD